jgi:hypothetical protein
MHRDPAHPPVAGWGSLARHPTSRLSEAPRVAAVSSLWTPDGERPVGQAPGPAPARPETGSPSRTQPGADHEALAELRRQLLATPAAVVVANHAYGLFELAALHLSATPPRLDEARLAVDALGGLVDAVADRLGDARESLVDALAQIRLAYVQIAGAHQAGAQQAGAGEVSRPEPS